MPPWAISRDDAIPSDDDGGRRHGAGVGGHTARWRCCAPSRDAGLVTKSNLILGMGETREEVSEALRDLHDAGTEIITITQYLRPSPRHHPVERWVKPAEFIELPTEATEHRLRRRDERTPGPLLLPGGRLYRQAAKAATISYRVTAEPGRGRLKTPTGEEVSSPWLTKPARTQGAAEGRQAGREGPEKPSTDPADMGRLADYRAYQLTHEYDKRLPLFVFRPPGPS